MRVKKIVKESAHKRIPTLEEVRAERARRRLYDFAVQAWPVTEPGKDFVDNWHIGAICEHLEAVSRGQIRRLVICVPPEHSKSYLVARCWPAWWWIHDSSFDWLFSSYASDRALNDSVQCRRIIESEWYKRNWGDQYYLTSDQNQKGRFENSKTGVRIAVGLLAAGTGEHADAVVCDDPNDIRDQWSPKKLEAVVNAWDQVMSRCVNDPKTSRHVIIMQRIHDKDLASHCRRQGGYEYLMLPSEYDPVRATATSIGWKDPRKAKGELLNPHRFGPAEIADARTRLATRGFSAQHQQNPSAEESTIFKRMWWRYYQEQPRRIAASMDEVVQSWDFAFKDLETSSKVAGHVWGKRGADTFLLDRICEHMDFVESLRAITKLTELWPQAAAKIVEDKANGPAVIATLHNKIMGLIPWPPQGRAMGSKIARAYAMQPNVEAGNVWLPHPDICPWIDEFIEYCSAFPGGEYDDDIDAMTQVHDRFNEAILGGDGQVVQTFGEYDRPDWS